jgi:hypothetical protein
MALTSSYASRDVSAMVRQHSRCFGVGAKHAVDCKLYDDFHYCGIAYIIDRFLSVFHALQLYCVLFLFMR